MGIDTGPDNVGGDMGPIKRVDLIFTGGDDTPGGILAWQNPEASPIGILVAGVKTTAVASAACAVWAGHAPDAVTASQSLVRLTDVHTNPLVGLTNDSNGVGASAGGYGGDRLDVGEWLTLSTNSGASAGLVGVLTLLYVVF